MNKIKWVRDTNAPFPSYYDQAGRFRIYRPQAGEWKLQDRHSPNHPDPILYTYSMADAKVEANSILKGEAS